MRTIFLGTPAIAVPFLHALNELTQLQAVITNPDQPAGRGYTSKPSAVKVAALNQKLPLFQPDRARDPAFVEQVSALAPALGIVVAYGKLLPAALLQIPRLGFLNVHFSLLPAYRGAAPIQWALINGEQETGVTLFWLDAGMDTGPIFLQERVPIGVGDTTETLAPKLVSVGVRLLQAGLEKLSKEGRTETLQSGAESRAPLLKKEDGRIDWNKAAHAIVNQVRGMTPWPGAYGLLSSGSALLRLKVLKANVVTEGGEGPVGTVVSLVSGQGFVIKCGDAYLLVTQLQPEGKKPMSAWDYWQGARLQLGERLA